MDEDFSCLVGPTQASTITSDRCQYELTNLTVLKRLTVIESSGSNNKSLGVYFHKESNGGE